jgi:hypothetical protein
MKIVTDRRRMGLFPWLCPLSSYSPTTAEAGHRLRGRAPLDLSGGSAAGWRGVNPGLGPVMDTWAANPHEVRDIIGLLPALQEESHGPATSTFRTLATKTLSSRVSIGSRSMRSTEPRALIQVQLLNHQRQRWSRGRSQRPLDGRLQWVTVARNHGGIDVVCNPQFPAMRGTKTDINGGTTNCIEP